MRARRALGVTLVAVIALAGLLAPWIAPFDPNASGADVLSGATATHWMGTDDLGRDVYSRVLHGARISLLVGPLAALVAALIGVPFGKHKIAPTISPAKSWEGCVGGLAASAGASALFAWLLRDAFGISFMVPWKAAVLALPIAVLSIPSDLIESVFKRLAGAKDSGATIPGIGGALDLIDSMVLTSPAALILLSYCLDWAKRAG